jgi:hypothetical protein
MITAAPRLGRKPQTPEKWIVLNLSCLCCSSGCDDGATERASCIRYLIVGDIVLTVMIGEAIKPRDFSAAQPFRGPQHVRTVT